MLLKKNGGFSAFLGQIIVSKLFKVQPLNNLCESQESPELCQNEYYEERKKGD